MYDYLNKYHLSESEKEWLLMIVIKRLYEIGRAPLWLHKRRNIRTWSKLKALYGDDVVRNIFHTLNDLGLTTHKDKLIVLNERGKAAYKRGWVVLNINKYANPKYPLVISILALIVSALNGQFTWEFIQRLLHIISKLCSLY